MIVLEEVAVKLSKILNKKDDEVSSDVIPFNFQFEVQTEGLHIDKIYDGNTGQNFIPVFVSFVGGQFDPVPNLQRGTFNVRVDFYLPVRFKNEFYYLNNTINQIFVAKFLNFGEQSGKCLCNVSPIEVGEIVGQDLKQFKTWTENKYQQTIDVMEMWLNVGFTLFLTSSNADFVYGNNVEYTLSFNIHEQSITIENNTVFGIRAYRYASADRVVQFHAPYYAYKNYDDDKIYYVGHTFNNIAASETVYQLNENNQMVASTMTVRSKNAETPRTLTENAIWTSSGTGYGNSPISQQLIDDEDNFAKNTSNIINYNKSIVVYFRVNEFWEQFLEHYNNNKMDEIVDFTVVKKYRLPTRSKTFEFEQKVLSINENISLGDLLSYTFVFGD